MEFNPSFSMLYLQDFYLNLSFLTQRANILVLAVSELLKANHQKQIIFLFFLLNLRSSLPEYLLRCCN